MHVLSDGAVGAIAVCLLLVSTFNCVCKPPFTSSINLLAPTALGAWLLLMRRESGEELKPMSRPS